MKPLLPLLLPLLPLLPCLMQGSSARHRGGVGSSDQTPIEPTARVWLELTEKGTDGDVHFESVS